MGAGCGGSDDGVWVCVGVGGGMQERESVADLRSLIPCQ